MVRECAEHKNSISVCLINRIIILVMISVVFFGFFLQNLPGPKIHYSGNPAYFLTTESRYAEGKNGNSICLVNRVMVLLTYFSGLWQHLYQNLHTCYLQYGTG